jgi:hypothetical protein
MNLIDYVKDELKAAGYNPDEDGPSGWMYENIIDLITVFSKQGHSGFSANHCINLFNKLARYEPLVPLSDNDEEWVEVSDNLWQNKRCSHVFKDKDKAWDIDGRIFVEKDGSCFTSSDSKVIITFPYNPKSEYIKVNR